MLRHLRKLFHIMLVVGFSLLSVVNIHAETSLPEFAVLDNSEKSESFLNSFRDWVIAWKSKDISTLTKYGYSPSQITNTEEIPEIVDFKKYQLYKIVKSEVPEYRIEELKKYGGTVPDFEFRGYFIAEDKKSKFSSFIVHGSAKDKNLDFGSWQIFKSSLTKSEAVEDIKRWYSFIEKK